MNCRCEVWVNTTRKGVLRIACRPSVRVNRDQIFVTAQRTKGLLCRNYGTSRFLGLGDSTNCTLTGFGLLFLMICFVLCLIKFKKKSRVRDKCLLTPRDADAIYWPFVYSLELTQHIVSCTLTNEQTN